MDKSRLKADDCIINSMSHVETMRNSTLLSNEFICLIDSIQNYVENRYMLYKIATILLKTFPILFLIVGTIGNTLSFVVLTSKSMRKTSTFCYLACLSLVDFAVIYTFSINFIMNHYFNYDIQTKSIIICRTYAFLIYFLPQYSSWILVLVSVDRVFKIIMCSGKLIWSDTPLSFLMKFCCKREQTIKLNKNNSNTQNNGENILTTNKKTRFKIRKKSFSTLIKHWNTPKGSIISVIITGILLFIINSQFFIIQIDQHSYIDTPEETKKFIVEVIGMLEYENDTNRHLIEYVKKVEIKNLTIDEVKQINYKKAIAFEVNPILCSPENNIRYRNFYEKYWVHLDTLINVLIPSLIMFISSLIICFTIRKSILKFRRRSRLVSVFYDIANNKSHFVHSNTIIRGGESSRKMPKGSQHSIIYNTVINDNKKTKINNPTLTRRCSSVPHHLSVIETIELVRINAMNSEMKNVKKRFGANIKCPINFRLIKCKPRLKNKQMSLKKPDKIYILVILVAINILFIILTAPIVFYLSLQTVPIYKLNGLNVKLIVRLVKTICICLMNANHAINILIYGLIGTMFRRKFVLILKEMKTTMSKFGFYIFCLFLCFSKDALHKSNKKNLKTYRNLRKPTVSNSHQQQPPLVKLFKLASNNKLKTQIINDNIKSFEHSDITNVTNVATTIEKSVVKGAFDKARSSI